MIRIFGSADETARGAATHAARIAAAAIAECGRARIALSGGRTPGVAYRALAEPPLRDQLDWSRVDLLFADERAVAADDRESNLRLVRETLLAGLADPGPRVVRMRADAVPPDGALAEYERALETPLDLLMLGVGADSHTASLFPGSPLLSDRERRVAMVLDSPKPPARRMTILPRAIEEARAVIVLVSGADKSRAVARALEEDVDAASCPARMLRDRSWFLDREAAAGLVRG
jgi:6-phosphogluconolactonase